MNNVLKPVKLITESPKNFEYEIIKESSGEGKPQTIKMKGVYIVADKVNGNGRVYPYDMLKECVDKFITESIDANTALEELEHPSCNLSKNFEVLTESGFKWFKDLKVGDLVWTLNHDTNQVELKPIKKIISQNYIGDGYIVHGKNFYGEFTANHRFITKDRYGKTLVDTIDNIANNRSKYHNNFIPKTLNINQQNVKTFVIPKCHSFALTKCWTRFNHARFDNDLIIDKKIFSQLFGFWLAEGSSRVLLNDNGEVTGGMIRLIQSISSNKNVCDLIDNLFENLPDELKEHSNTYLRNDFKIWTINDLRLAKYFNDCGNIYTKHIPQEVLDFEPEYLEQLVYYFGLGDGRKTVFHLKKYNNLLLDNIKEVFSVSEKLIDDLSYCILKCGLGTAKRCVITKKDYSFRGRIIKYKNKHPLYIASILTSKGISLDKRTLKIEKIECKEDDDYGAYCIQVDNTSFYQRVNGKCYWTGNCIEINPQRVCCRTLSLEEDKNCWIGTSVVLASDEKFGIKGTPCGDLLKSLLQFGTAVGHSTRGVGDVDKNGVVTDYQLICIDTVLSPSVGIFNDSNASRMVDGILESKRFLMDMHGNIFEDKYGTLSKRLSKTPNTFIKETKNQHLVNAINEFLNSFIK